MVKNNLSGILIALGAMLVSLFLPIEPYSIVSYVFLIVGVGCMISGILIQRKIKNKLKKKELIDSLPD
ncbi:MAG TPA: hypothetical protein VFP97_08040 [Chitinophagaceae bacterium]|nr:hypothetical protein [Chitinophagaceae bacterium]